jgi:hypothetical protein
MRTRSRLGLRDAHQVAVTGQKRRALEAGEPDQQVAEALGVGDVGLVDLDPGGSERADLGEPLEAAGRA